jgi:hypothetical protein
LGSSELERVEENFFGDSVDPSERGKFRSSEVEKWFKYLIGQENCW